MSPLQTFQRVAGFLEGRSFSFLSKEQQSLPHDSLVAAQRLKQLLEKKELTDTMVYRRLVDLEADCINTPFDELNFLRHLTSLMTLYEVHGASEDTKELLENTHQVVARANQRALEENSLQSALQKKGRKMTDEEKQRNDLEVIQKVGIFYVLECMLQIFFEFTKSDETRQWKLVKEGLNISAGSLPPLIPEVIDGFRRELCFALFGVQLRDTCLRAFYDFQDALKTGELSRICAGLKAFNLQLLLAFCDGGLEKYHGAIYAPLGNDILISDLIQTIETMELSS